MHRNGFGVEVFGRVGFWDVLRSVLESAGDSWGASPGARGVLSTQLWVYPGKLCHFPVPGGKVQRRGFIPASVKLWASPKTLPVPQLPLAVPSTEMQQNHSLFKAEVRKKP